MGGDEFAIVQVSRDQPAAGHALCRRLVKRLSAPFKIDGHELHIGASVGVAVAPTDGHDHEQLLKNADIALYRAKQAGRGTYRFFEAVMDFRAASAARLEQDLRQALAKDQFELHYQPLVAIDGYDLSGVEALLRWRHPERGWCFPGGFISVAEEAGLIVSIGEWVLRHSLQSNQTVAGPAALREPFARTVQASRAVADHKEVLAETGLDPRRLDWKSLKAFCFTERTLFYRPSRPSSPLELELPWMISGPVMHHSHT